MNYLKPSLPLLLIITFFVGCSSKDVIAPKLEEQKIEQKNDLYTDALSKLGKMTKVYESSPLYIQTKGVVDDTGVSQRMSSRGEIPYDITEMFKSSVNDIAGSVRMIDYDPTHQSNMMALGYTNFEKKLKPDIIISGGITEFDKSISVSKQGADGAGESGNFGLSASYSEARATDRVTIDVNLIEFDTFAMIPSMTTVNSVNIYSGRNSADVGFSILANNFGVNGEVKTIQGRHAAVRTLVKYSIVEVLGRYMNLPYWNLLPNGKEDSIVIENIKEKYFAANRENQILMIQKLLYLHGYDLVLDGKAGQQSLVQLRLYLDDKKATIDAFNFKTFKKLYTSVPLKDNYRTAAIFEPLPTEEPEQIAQAQTMAKPEETAQDIAKSPQDLVSFQEIFSDKKVTGIGIYKNKNETIARHVATNLAINDAAKKVGSVLQKESTQLTQDEVRMLISTQAKNIIKGYEKIKEEYNDKTKRAVVEIQLEGSVVAAKLEKLLEE